MYMYMFNPCTVPVLKPCVLLYVYVFVCSFHWMGVSWELVPVLEC